MRMIANCTSLEAYKYYPIGRKDLGWLVINFHRTLSVPAMIPDVSKVGVTLFLSF